MPLLGVETVSHPKDKYEICQVLDPTAAGCRTEAVFNITKAATVAAMLDPDRDGSYDEGAALAQALKDWGELLVRIFQLTPGSHDQHVYSSATWLVRELHEAMGVAWNYVLHSGRHLINSTGLPQVKK